MTVTRSTKQAWECQIPFRKGGLIMQTSRQSCFISTICVAILAVVSIAAAQSPNPHQELALGRQALAQGKYDEAIQHFENINSVVQMNVILELDLAGAFAQKYLAGVDDADNEKVADKAIDYYQRVIEGDTSITASESAEKGIAFLDAHMNKFDEAKEHYDKAKKLNPEDPEPFYFTAVIDWTLSNQFRQQERTKLKLKPEDSLAAEHHEVCQAVKDKNASNLAEALENLNKALDLDPKYEDAINYMNLIYIERADVECDDPGARKSDLKAADEWAQKLIVVKRTKAAHPQKDGDQ